MKTKPVSIVTSAKLLMAGFLLLLSGAFAVQAQPVVRANTAGPLNLTTAWTNNVAPGSGDIAQWDSTVATAANTTAALGADTTWTGINIYNPVATVVISAGNTLTLGSSGVNMSGASANLTFSSGLTLGSPQTWTVASGRTLTVNGALLNAGANALTITGAGTEAIAAATAITATGGFTKNGSGPLTITGQATPTTSITTLTVNGGIGTISSGGAANSLNNTANIVVGGGTFNYQYNSAVNQAVAGLTINAGEGGALASRNGSFNQGLTFSGTVTRNLGGTIYSKLLDSGRGFTIFNNLTASTIAKDANGTPFMTTGNAYSGATTDIYNDWGGVNSGHQVVVATYTSTTASSLGTSAQNANVAVATTTLAANAVDTSFRDAVNQATTIDLHGFTWQTGGILVNAAVVTAGSIIEDTVGGSTLTGPANGDIVMMIDANLTTPKPFTISANIVNNTSTAITKGAPGTLILSGINTFTGGVFLNDGTLQVGSAGALNSTTPNAINFDGNGLIGVQNTGLGPNPVAPVLALAGNSIAVASLSTANNLSGVVPAIKNANGSSVANAILTISGGSTTTFTGTIQDGTGGGTLGLTENGAGTQTIGGTLSYSGPTTVSAGTLVLASAPSATPSYTVNGTLDVTALSGSSLTLGSQTLSGAGTVNGTVTTASGSVLAPGSGTATTGGSGTNTMSNLTLAGGSAVNYGLSVADPNISQISVGAGTLTLPSSGTVTLNLYTPGTSTPFAAAGTYNLFKFTTGVNTNSLASRFSIGTSITGFLPTFGTAAGPGGTTYLTLTLAANTGVIATWNPTPDANGIWSAGTNWTSNPNVPHAAGDAATLGVAAGLRTVTLDANESVGTLAMTNANSFVIANSGNTLTLDNKGVGASLTVSAGTQNAINTALALNDNTAATVSGGALLTVAGSITNSPGANDALTINGAGTTILSAANSYGPLAGTNGTILSGGGILQVGNSTSLGTGDLNVAGISTLQAGAASLSLANNISVGGGVTATVDNNGYNFALAGVISGGGNLLQVGTGTLTLGSANTYGGSTTVNAGTLSISGDGSLGTAPGSVTLNSVILNGGDLLGSANNPTLNANRGVGIGATVGATPGTALIDAASGQTLTVNGIIQTAGNSGANNITVNSLAPTPGTVVLGGANTFNGTTVIANGTLELSNSLALQNSTLNYNTGTLTFGGNITAATIGQFTGSQNLILNNQAATPAGVTLTTGGNNATWTNANSLSGLGGLTKAGTGNLILSGANSYSGGTTINGGILTLTNGGVINGSFVSPLTGNLVVNGGTLTSSAGSTVGTTTSGQSIQVLSGNVAYNGGIGTAIDDGQTISVLGGTFSASSVSIGRTAAYATAPTVLAPISANQNDGFYVNGGTATLGGLIIGSAGANSSASGRIDSGNVTVTNQFLLGDTTSTTRYSILQVNGGTLTSLDTISGILINRNNGANLNLAELYLSGGVTTANLITFGTNSDTVNNTGFLIINGGILYLGSGGIVKGHATDTVTIGLTNGLIGATADWSSSLAMQLSGTNFTIQAADPSGAAHNITLTGVLGGTGGLTKTGNGTLTLNSAGNTYSGVTAINAGTLNINSEWALGGANYGGLSFSNGTLQYAVSLLNSTTDVSTKPVSFITNAIIDVNGNNVSYANPVGNNGAGGLTIESTTSGGVLNLNGTNTYTGNTTVASGATLGGSGSIGGAVEIQSGAILAPGNNGVGTLTNGSLTLDSGMVGNFEFNGVANDQVVVTNALVLNDPSDNVAFNLYQAGGTLGMTQPGTYNLIQYAGSGPTLGSSWTTASGSNPHVANPQPGFLYQFHATGGFLVLKITLSGSVVSGTWTNDADGNWTTATNWDSNPNVPHSPGDLATLGIVTALRTVTLNANEDVGTLTLNNNNSFVIADSGKTLTLDNNGHGANVYVSAGTANQINSSVALNDSATVVAGSGKSLTVSGNIVNGNNGSEVLNLNGTGILALTGNNSYGPGSGGTGTRLNGGILRVGSSTALGTSGVSFTGDATLQAGVSAGLNNNIDVSPGMTATVDTSGNILTLNGPISDGGNLTKIGNGTLVFPENLNNTYTGTTTVSGGVLSVAYDPNVYNSSNIVLNGGILLGNGQSDNGYEVIIDPPMGIGPTSGSVGGTALIDAVTGTTLDLQGLLTSAGNTGTNNLVVNSGAGDIGTVSMTVDGNTYNGTTVISNGVLDVASSLPLAFSTLNYNNQGGYLWIDGITSITLGGLAGAQNLGLTNLNGNGVALTVGNNNASTTYSGNLNDAGSGGSLTKSGTGTLTLAGTNSYVLPTTISAGVLRINTNGVLDTVSASVPSVAGAQLVVSGGTLVVTNTSNIGTPSAGLLVSSGSATFLAPLTTTLGSDNGNLVAVTGGYLSVSNLSLGRTGISDTTQPTAGSTTSGLYVNGGTMNIVANLDMGISTAANSTVNARIDSGSLTVGGVVTIGLNNGGRWSVVDVNGGSLTVTNTTTGISVGGPLSGNAELLVRAGTATVGMISMGQTASGSTNMTAVVNLTNGSLYIGSGGITQVSTGALFTSTITLNGGTLGAIANWSSTNNMVLGGAAIQTADSNGNPWNIALSGVLSGTKLNKTGAGTLTLSGPNTYNGATTISNGTLALVAPGLITNTPQVSIAAGATFDVSALSGYSFTGANPVQTLAGISTNGAGTVNVTGNALTLASGAKVLLAAAGGASPTIGKISVTGGLVFAANNPVTINVGGGILGAGNYRLLDCTGNLSGSATNTPAFTGLGATPGAAVLISTTTGAAGHVDLSVGKGTLTLQTATATSILLGQALSNATLAVIYTNATGGAVSGTAVFTSPGTVPLGVGTATYQVQFTPTDTTDYNTPAPINVNVTVISPVLIPTQSAGITGFNMVGGNVVINGTNGQSGGTYYLLETTNVADPISIWRSVATNIVSTNGPEGAFTFTGTNTVTSGGAQQFYILSNTNN